MLNLEEYARFRNEQLGEKSAQFFLPVMKCVIFIPVVNMIRKTLSLIMY